MFPIRCNCITVVSRQFSNKIIFAVPTAHLCGGSGTVEGLNFRRGQLLVRLRAAGVFCPFVA